MNLDKLLEYQSADLELKFMQNEIDTHPLNGKLEKARREFDAAKANLEAYEKTAQRILEINEQSGAYYGDGQKEFAELQKALKECGDSDADKRAAIVSKLEELRAKVSKVEKALGENKKRSDDVIKAYQESHDRGKKFRDIYYDAKKRFDAFKSEREPKIAELTKKRDAMRPNLDPGLFSAYKALVDDGKTPAVVESRTVDNGKTYSCKGCGLSLSQQSKGELLERGVCRCDNCRRIIYKK
ncbi:MAG: hypothetical protein LBP26_07515 [Clostridiales bacterium]|jgi:predicted  nucleic acid-binding Zn-ribbon protein|nr:hypothetical protein [Clostridiales bacterium]